MTEGPFELTSKVPNPTGMHYIVTCIVCGIQVRSSFIVRPIILENWS